MLDTRKTGDVWLRDYDEGVVYTLGCEIGVDNRGEPQYFLNVPDIAGGKVPVFFVYPEFEVQDYVLPSIIIRRRDIVNSFDRWLSVGEIKYREGKGELINGIGYPFYEMQKQSMTFEIPYDIEIITRFRNDALKVLKKVWKIFPPYGKIFVKDSLGDIRSYECFADGPVPIDEIIDVTAKLSGFLISIRVIGEIDLEDPYVEKSVEKVDFNMSKV